MTLIQKPTEANADTMEGSPVKEDGSKSLRPVRNRRYTRLVQYNMTQYFQFVRIISLCVTIELRNVRASFMQEQKACI